jgi:hypothetical protein
MAAGRYVTMFVAIDKQRGLTKESLLWLKLAPSVYWLPNRA